MKYSPLRPGKKCPDCSKGKTTRPCKTCDGRGFIIKPPKPRQPVSRKRAAVKPISDKRKTSQREYTKLRAEFLLANPRCQVLRPGGCCIHPATEIHHRAGRYANYLNVGTFLGVCQACHKDIHETHQSWARTMGYLTNPAARGPIPDPSPIFIPYTNAS